MAIEIEYNKRDGSGVKKQQVQNFIEIDLDVVNVWCNKIKIIHT